MAQLDETALRQQLLAERERLQGGIYDRTEGDQAVVPVDPLLDSGGLTGGQADDADAVADFNRNQAVVRNSQDLLGQVNAALDRLDQGKYGVCERCGQAIDPRRLAALPYATLCVQDQEVVDREQSQRQA